MRTIIYILFVFLFISSFCLRGQVISLSSDSDTSVSVAFQFHFVSDYPVGDIYLKTASPTAFNSNGDKVSACFYLLPTDYLPFVALGYDSFRLVCVPSLLFFDEENYIITISPTEPLQFNTSYSVIFDNFPFWIPDINTNEGYVEMLFTDVFIDCATTIGHPLHITDVSFQKTGNIIWGLSEDIVVHFNKPIYPRSDVLDSIFKVVKIGDQIETEPSQYQYSLLDVPVSVSLDSSRTFVTLSPLFSYEPGNSYYLSVNWDDYLGDDYFNNSYGFMVPDRIGVDISVSFSGDPIPSAFSVMGHTGQKLYHNGDTVRIGYPSFYDKYYLSEWVINSGLDAPVYRNGELLEIILDDDNFFSGSSGNSLYRDLKTGIKVTAVYRVSPIDTFVIDYDIESSVYSSYPNILQDFTVSNYLQQVAWNQYTYYRYTDNPLTISYSGSEDLLVSITDSINSTSVPLGSVSIPVQYYFGVNASALNPGGIPIGGGNNGGTVVVVLDSTSLKYKSCEAVSLAVELHYMGFGDGRAFEDEKANIRDMIANISFSFDGQHYPVFSDSITGAGSKFSSVMSFHLDSTFSSPVSPILPVNIGYSVSLSNPDYEIFLVDAYHGLKSFTVDNIVPYPARVWKGRYGVADPYYKTMYVYTNYSGDDRDISSISGNITVNISSDSLPCGNRLMVYIRRNVVSFWYDVVNDKNYTRCNGVPVLPFSNIPNFRDFRLDFPDLPPISMPDKDFRPNSYFFLEHLSDPVDPNQNYYLCTGYGPGEFFSVEKPISDYRYQRRWLYVADLDDPSYGVKTYPYRDCITVFYYSGEDFTYVPLIRENIGIKLGRMSEPQVSTFTYDSLTASYKVTGYRLTDYILCSSDEDFRLDYFELPKKENGGKFEFVKYAVDDIASDKYNAPLWTDGLLDDYDNGIYLNTGGGVAGSSLHSHTAYIRFKFNIDPDTNSFSDNIKIYDAIELEDYTELRPDGMPLTNYRPIFDNPQGVGNWMYDGVGPGLIGLKIVNMLSNPRQSICNLQKFNIEVINTVLQPLVSWEGEELSNIPQNRPFVRFMGSTIPPGLSMSNKWFHNFSWQYPRVFWGITWWKVDPDVFIGNSITTITHESPMPPIDSIRTFDTNGRLTYSTNVKRFPSSSHKPNFEPGNFWHNTDPLYSNSTLTANQNILNLYHWTDDWKSCGNNINTFSNAAKVVAKIYAAIKTGGADIPLGKDSVVIDSLGNKDTVKKAINVSSTVVDGIVDGLASVAKSLICKSDEEMGMTNFWLSRTGQNKYFNNQYKIYDDYNEPFNYSDTSITAGQEQANIFFNRWLYQDWSLWGVGKYGMYKEYVKRDAYDIRFDFKEQSTFCGFSLVDGNLYLKFRPIFTSCPRIGTRIEIWTGDNR